MKRVRECWTVGTNTAESIHELILKSKKKYECNLCKDDKNFKINFISGMNCTSNCSTFDLGMTNNIKFCPECGRQL